MAPMRMDEEGDNEIEECVFFVYNTFIHAISQLAAMCTELTKADATIAVKMVVVAMVAVVVPMAIRTVFLA